MLQTVRHQRLGHIVVLVVGLVVGTSNGFAADALRVGIAVADITPPVGFPIAGYYHERLADGTIDPLKAKAIVFRDANAEAALVVCDLIGIATDLSQAVRQRASEKTGIPATNIVISATHSHTAPDYMKELYLKLGNEGQEPLRAAYIDKLINGPVEAIVKAHAAAKPAVLECGSAMQATPVSFNRRSVMRDGSVKTWQSHDNPEVVRAAGPIDSEIALLNVRDEAGKSLGNLRSRANDARDRLQFRQRLTNRRRPLGLCFVNAMCCRNGSLSLPCRIRTASASNTGAVC